MYQLPASQGKSSIPSNLPGDNCPCKI